MTILKHTSGHTINIPSGFSFTTFFFGYWVPILRGDAKWAIIMFLLTFLTLGISQIVFAFIYNKIYRNEKIKEGYEIV